MDHLAMQFGKRLRQLRKARNLTQEQLGHAAKVDWKFVGAIERGIKSPSFPVLGRIAKALKAEPYELFLPERLATGQLEQHTKAVLADLKKIDHATIEYFFSELLQAVQNLERGSGR
jgi:transcriptional regulator with XRE-family HTH domain